MKNKISPVIEEIAISPVIEEIANIPVPQRLETPKRGDAVVFDKVGNYVRTYTQELHGKDYGKIAKGYANKIGGTVRG